MRFSAGDRMGDQDFIARLESYLAGRLPAERPLRVIDLDRSTEGFSQETFSFDVETATGTRRGFVLKREPLAGLLEPYDLEPEFRVLHALSDDPLPSPPTPWFERDPAVLERSFYVMARLPGDVPVPAPRADGSPPVDDGDRPGLGADVVAALARLHGIDWRSLGLDFLGVPAAGRDTATRELARWERRIDASGLAVDPPLAEALVLAASQPAGDRRDDAGARRLSPGQLPGRARRRRRAAERAPRLGDGPPGRPAGGRRVVHLAALARRHALCAAPCCRPRNSSRAWEAATGRTADPRRLEFYGVLAIVKMIAIMLTGLRAFRDGRTTDLRMAIFDQQLPFLHLMLGMTRGWLG